MKHHGIFKNLELQAQTLVIPSLDPVLGGRTLATVAENLHSCPSFFTDCGL